MTEPLSEEHLALIRMRVERSPIENDIGSPITANRDRKALLGERDRLARQVEAFKHTAGDVAQRYQGEVATLRKALAAMNGPIQLWNHAEACVTGTGCTHDSDSDCADSLLHHAANLMREASRERSKQ